MVNILGDASIKYADTVADAISTPEEILTGFLNQYLLEKTW